MVVFLGVTEKGVAGDEAVVDVAVVSLGVGGGKCPRRCWDLAV